MAYPTCEDCGSRLYGGCCPNCDEKVFIEEQYQLEGEPVPRVIANAAYEQRVRRGQ